jgi:hypothetical protein
MMAKRLAFLLCSLLLLTLADARAYMRATPNEHPHYLTVVNGDGDGNYRPGKVVPILATLPTSEDPSERPFEFVSWIQSSGDGHLADSTSSSTTFTMGYEHAEVVAVFARLKTWFPPSNQSCTTGLLLPQALKWPSRRLEQLVHVDTYSGDSVVSAEQVFALLNVRFDWQEQPLVGYYSVPSGFSKIQPGKNLDKAMFSKNGTNAFEASLCYEGLWKTQDYSGREFPKVTTTLTPVFPVNRTGAQVIANLLPVDVTKLWSDQLTGVTDANYLPNKTGQADRAYLLMGACQSNNFDLKGHLKAKVNVGDSPELRNKILWRLAGKSGSTYVPENGTSTYNANGDEVTIVLDNPRTDDDNSYYLVAGYDQDGNGQLSSAEASVVPKYKWKRKVNGQLRTDDHDYEVKIISRSRYDQARQTLNSLAGTWNTVGLSQASRLMSAYLNEQTPTGATAVPVMIGRDEPGLTHSVGVLFAAPGNPGQSITATFAPASQMTADVLDSTTFNNWLSDQFEQKRQEVASRFQNSEEIIETFVWNFKGDLSFSVASDPDLFFALGRTKVDVTVEVEVHRFLYTVESTRVTGSVTDLYDFDYDDRSGYAGYGDFVRDAARVQAGYNTIGTGGRVYKSDVQISNSPHSIQFQFQ